MLYKHLGKLKQVQNLCYDTRVYYVLQTAEDMLGKAGSMKGK